MKQCFFCSQNIKVVDYKDSDLLKKFISSQRKIIDPKHTGTCAKHQRMVSSAVKKARFLGLIPYTEKRPGSLHS